MAADDSNEAVSSKDINTAELLLAYFVQWHFRHPTKERLRDSYGIDLLLYMALPLCISAVVIKNACQKMKHSYILTSQRMRSGVGSRNISKSKWRAAAACRTKTQRFDSMGQPGQLLLPRCPIATGNGSRSCGGSEADGPIGFRKLEERCGIRWPDVTAINHRWPKVWERGKC